MKQTKFNWAALVGGLLLVAAGVSLLIAIAEPQGILLALPYVCIGVGCGLFGHGTGSLISMYQNKKNPKMARMVQIEQQDERNIALINRAKAKAWDIMIYTFSVLLLAVALIGAPLPIVLLLVAAYLFIIGCEQYYVIRYNREM